MSNDALEAKWRKVLDEGRPIRVPEWVDKKMVSKLLANQERLNNQERLKLSPADEKRYREEYLGEVICK